MLTWIEPRDTRRNMTLLAAAQVFVSMFRDVLIASGVIALLVGFVIGNVIYVISITVVLWMAVIGMFALLFFIGKFAPKRITVDKHAIIVTHFATRKYPLSEIEQLAIMEQGLSTSTLSFVRKARNVGIKVVLGIAPEVDLDSLRNRLK